MNRGLMRLFIRLAALALAGWAPVHLALAQTIPAAATWNTATTPVRGFDVHAVQEGRSQTRVWTHGGATWAVLADIDGSYLYRLDGRTWARTSLGRFVPYLGAKASVVVDGDRVHISMLHGHVAHIVNLQYDAALGQYQVSSPRAGTTTWVVVGFEASVATLAKDSTGRLWLVSDTSNAIVARHSSPPYTSWSLPITVATGVQDTDISGVVALPNQSIGVFWSNRNTNRFGFRTRADSAPPGTWRAIETPDKGPNPNMGVGPADQQFNLAVARDGRVFAAVKVNHTNTAYPLIGLLVRGTDGVWAPLSGVDTRGARPAVALDETSGLVRVVYTSAEAGGDLLMAEAPMANPVFTQARVLATGTPGKPAAWSNASVTPGTASGDGAVLAFAGTRATGIVLKSTPRGPDVMVAHIPGEAPAATTARLQGLIDTASSTGAGLRFAANKTFDVTAPLFVRFPGPRYIDGGYSTLRRVAAPAAVAPAPVLPGAPAPVAGGSGAGATNVPGAGGAVLHVESAQDGVVIRDLNILASDGTYAEPKDGTCSITWAHDKAQHGIVLANTRWATLRSVSVWHAAQAGIRIEPTFGDNEGTLIEASSVRYSGDGLQIAGTATNRVRSARLLAATLLFSRNNAAHIRFAEDLQIHGGSLEKAQLDLLKVEDSTRLQALVYLENFGGYSWNTVAKAWCPRTPSGNAVELTRSTHVLVRGRNWWENDRGTVGDPLLASADSSVYRVASQYRVFGTLSWPVAAITQPSMGPRFEQAVADAHLGEPVDILPGDAMTTVRAKIAQAAAAGVGVRLQPGGVYNWEPISLRWRANHPAYIDGRGATLNLLPSPTLAVAALKFFAPHSAWEIGKDRFSVHNLTINVGGRAQYGMLLETNMGTTIRGVTVNDAVEAGFRADGTAEGGGIYYTQFADNTVNRSRIGMQFSTFNGIVEGKRVGANLIDNFTAVDVGTVYDFAWTSSTEILNSRNAYTPGYTGPRLLLNGAYISDVEFYRTLFNGVQPSEAHITVIGWSPGIFFDLAQ